MAENVLKRSLQAVNSGKKFTALEMVRVDPGMAAMLSKLIPAEQPANYDKRGNMEPTAPDVGAFRSVSQATAESVSDAETVMQVLPDTKLSAQVLVSSILSPKDFVTTELSYAAPEGLMAPEVAAALTARIRQHFEQDYKIKDKLHRILEDMLFNTGSYAVAVIPENSIDDIINSPRRISMESLSEHVRKDGSIRNVGILGPAIRNMPKHERQTPGISMENFEEYSSDTSDTGRVTFEGILEKKVDDSYLTVVDNYSVLKIPQINEKIREERIADRLQLPTLSRNLASQMGGMDQSYAMESYSSFTKEMGKMNDRELTGLIYKHHQYSYSPISSLKTQEQLNRRSVGNPLVVHLPSESVIPVYVPGSPEQHVGFFVMIDADGNPVTREKGIDHYSELQNRMNMNGSFPSAMMSKVNAEMKGYNTLGMRDKIDYSVKAYADMVEADLLARLRNGVYGNGVSLAKREEVYRIMLSRALAKQHTQILFVPVELMTYFAFKYNDDGVGKSLLDDQKILNSMRMMLIFANVMASLKNSIGRTAVKLNLDEDDQDPQKTIETAIHEIIRTRMQYFPLGVNSPTDLTDYLQRAAFEVSYDGHPGLPKVGIEFEQKNDNYVKPDTELEENLKKRSIMGYGLSPDSIDAGFQAEFATSLLANNLLLAKRVMQHQDAFTPQLSDHCRKNVMNSEKVMQDLREILTEKYELLDPDNEDLAAGTARAREAIQDKSQAKSDGAFVKSVDKAVEQKNETNATGETTPSATENQPSPAETETPAAPAEPAFVEPQAAPRARGIPAGATGLVTAKKPADKEPTDSEKSRMKEHRKLFIIEEVLIQFVRGFDVTLPRPNSATLDNQATAMETYGKLLDAGLDAWINDKFFTADQAGEIGGQVEALRESVKAYFMRRWMSENGVMPELSDLTTSDETGKPTLNLFDAQVSHLTALMTSFTKQSVKLQVVRNATNEILDKTGAATGGSSGGGDTGGTDDFGAGTGDDFNADPGDGGGGGGEAETPPGDETPEPGEPGTTPGANPDENPGENEDET